jgi:FMN-dependent NADH-azoreductase
VATANCNQIEDITVSTLLVIHTSPRKESVSRALTGRFVEKWRASFPAGNVIHRDIGAKPQEHLDDDLIDALRRDPDSLNDRQQAAVEASDAMIEELQQADAIVIGAPMHNFTISGTLRTWIDHVARPGKTFGYDPDKGPVGLLDDKPVYIISSRGGQYGDGDPANPHPADFQSGYLRHIFGFIGIDNVQIIAANGQDMGPEAKDQGLAEAEGKIDALVFDEASATAAA